MKDYAKIPISDFVSDKKLSKIEAIINKADDVDSAYDRIELLLEENYAVKDLGTNRLILISKKDKYKHLIFKVAGDKHGIEANYREFYNGDIDKRLTKSFSISKNGVFLVQEKVKPLKSSDLDERKSDIRDMLDHLSKKLLLVDCKVSNFKNFGIRKNGDVCLLDHGDTVPLVKYQGDKIINVNEESYVSLHCKTYKNPSNPDLSKLKPCGGKLKYSKNFDFLECSKCGNRISVNDAYREFEGDRLLGNTKTSSIELSDEFYDWQRNAERYCFDVMNDVENGDNDNDTKMEDEKMAKEKIINGEKHININSYWIPEKYTVGAYHQQVVLIKTKKMSSDEYLKKLGLNPNDYKVSLKDHVPNENKHVPSRKIVDYTTDENVDVKSIAEKVVDKAISKFKTTGNTNNSIDFSDVLDSENIATIKSVWYAVKNDERVKRAKYDLDEKEFLVEINEPAEIDYDDSDADDDDDEVVEEREDDNDNKRNKFLVEVGKYQSLPCYKHENYYVPVSLCDEDVTLSDDDAESILDDEGYNPSTFHVDKAKVKRLINSNGKLIPVCDDVEINPIIKNRIDNYITSKKIIDNFIEDADIDEVKALIVKYIKDPLHLSECTIPSDNVKNLIDDIDDAAIDNISAVAHLIDTLFEADGWSAEINDGDIVIVNEKLLEISDIKNKFRNILSDDTLESYVDIYDELLKYSNIEMDSRLNEVIHFLDTCEMYVNDNFDAEPAPEIFKNVLGARYNIYKTLYDYASKKEITASNEKELSEYCSDLVMVLTDAMETDKTVIVKDDIDKLICTTEHTFMSSDGKSAVVEFFKDNASEKIDDDIVNEEPADTKPEASASREYILNRIDRLKSMLKLISDEVEALEKLI